MRDTDVAEPARTSPSAIDVAVADARDEAFTVLGGRADLGFVLFCDHASNALPREYGTLGMAAAELERHIAYDIGAAGVVRRIAAATGVPAILSRYSRLLIDLNRGPDDPTLIMRLSDGAVVPGNRHLGDDERRARIARFYDPYHAAAGRMIDRCLDTGHPPAILSVHTFTPSWRGDARPWHASILWDKDPRLAHALLDGLRSDPALVVGDNEPYSGRLAGDSMWRHGTMRGLAHAIVEIRQDLVAAEEGQIAWAERLATIMCRLMACDRIGPLLRRIEHHGSHTDAR